MLSKIESEKGYQAISLIVSSLMAILLFSCGADDAPTDRAAASNNTGSYAFSLDWPDDVEDIGSNSMGSRAVNCSAAGIDTIVAAFYDGDGEIIKDPPDEFACSSHRGTIDGLPPGSNYRVVINGEDASGNVLYQGEDTGVEIVAGETTLGGEIQMVALCTDNDSDTYFAESGCGTEIDCNDDDDEVYPGAAELCDDDTDNDCDGDTDCEDDDCLGEDACCTDADSDTYFAEDGCGTAIDCNDDDDEVYPGAAELCDDNTDNDCDGDTDCEDTDCSDDFRCEVDYVNSLGMTFNLIQPGTFTMGSPGDELGRDGDEIQHQVTLTQSFYMQTTEVTQGQWEAVMGSNPSYFTDCGYDCPVEQVSWEDVQEFIAMLNDLGEGTYRLPTEAEWEYAARAGSTTAFANGDITETECGIDPNLNAMGWYCGNANLRTHPVSQKQPNVWGLYDMHGNIEEWCQDWYENYPSGSVIDPQGPYGGLYRVSRGGSWIFNARNCRSADREYHLSDFSYRDKGFRLVRIP